MADANSGDEQEDGFSSVPKEDDNVEAVIQVPTLLFTN